MKDIHYSKPVVLLISSPPAENLASKSVLMFKS